MAMVASPPDTVHRWSAATNKWEQPEALKPPPGVDGILVWGITPAMDQPGIAFVIGAYAYKTKARTSGFWLVACQCRWPSSLFISLAPALPAADRGA